MNCRIASRIVSSSQAQKSCISPAAIPTLATRLFRRIASKGTRPVPMAGWCEEWQDKQAVGRWFVATGVAVHHPRGGKRRVGWGSIVPATSFLPSTLTTNGARS